MQKKKFMIYRRDARKGSSAYSPKPHSAPHFEGHYVEGMEEWASHYCFNKRDDGKYEAELDGRRGKCPWMALSRNLTKIS